MKTDGWLKILVSMMLVVILLYPASSEETQVFSNTNAESLVILTTNSDNYFVNDNIVISIEPSSLSGIDISNKYELAVKENGLVSKYLGELKFPITYIATSVGEIQIQLLEKSTGKIISTKVIYIFEQNSNKLSNQLVSNIIVENTITQNINCEAVSVQTNKETYFIGEEVQLTINNRPQNSLTSVVITSKNKIYRHDGNSNYAIFPAYEEGEYDVFFDCNAKQLIQTRFTVIAVSSSNENNEQNNNEKNVNVVQQITNQDNLNATNSNDGVQNHVDELMNEQLQNGQSQNPQSPSYMPPFILQNSKGEIKNLNSKVLLTFAGVEKEIKNPTATIKSIRFKDLKDYLPLLKAEDLDKPYPVNNINAVQSYAIDPRNVDFSSATLTATAKGNALYKCKDYDFENQNCFGSWEKVRDIIPGEDYEIILTRQDPLFSELNTSYSCSCQDAASNVNSDTLVCSVYCQHTIQIPPNATSFKLTSMIYDVGITITKSAGMSTESGAHFGIYDHDQTTNNGNEARIGTSTTTVTTTTTFTNSTISQSGATSYNDLDCSNWPSYCTYYIYLNSTYTFKAPGSSRRAVVLNISLNSVNYTINYTTPGNFNVLLNSPDNNYYTNLRHRVFTYTPTNAQYSISSCSIYTNETLWSAKNTSSSITNGSQNTIYATFNSDGIFAWNIRCNDSTGDNASAISNRTIIVDTLSPTVTQISPANGYTETDSSVISFAFNATDLSGIENCSLYVNNILRGTNFDIESGEQETISYSLQNGIYNWSIRCFDVAGNSYTTGNRTLNMSVTPRIYSGYWYETYTSNCATTPCQIDLNYQTDGVQNAITGTIGSAQTATIVEATSPYMGGNGAYIASGSTVLFSTYFQTAGGNLVAKWYLYSQSILGSNNLICSNTAGAGVSSGATSTGTCTSASDIRLLSTDKLYYVIDLTNSHPSQSRTFDHRIDYITSFFNASGFLQVGYLYASLLSPISPQVYDQGTIFNLTCSVNCTFGSCVDTLVYAQYNNSGSWASITSSSGIIRLDATQTNPNTLSTIFNTTVNTTFSLNASTPGIEQIRCYATSKYENTATNLVQISVASTQPPNVTLNYPLNNSWINLSLIPFRYTPETFNLVDNCSIYVNDIFNYTNSTITSNVQNYFYVSNFLETRYNWSVRCIDANSAQGNSSTYYFNVDTKAPYAINLHEPEQNSNTTSQIMNFNWTAYDATSPTLSCSLLINGTVNSTQTINSNETANATATNLRIGNYTWTVRCTDLAGNVNSSETRTFQVVDQPPIISLVYPANNTGVNTYLPTLLYNASDNFDLTECRLYINGVYNQSNSSSLINGGINNFTVSLLEEQYNWSVMCIDDNFNNATTKNWTFYVDATYPSVELITPLNNSFQNNSSIQFAFNATDNFAQLYCGIYVDGILNVSVNTTSGNIVNLTRTGYGDGEHDWYVTCADTANNTNISETRNLTINETPKLIALYPVNNSYLPYDDVVIEYSAIDNDGFLTCELYINGTLNQTNSSNVISGQTTNFTLTNLAEGTYEWTVRCIDDGIYSNENTTQSSVFTVDTSSPVIDLLDPIEFQVINTSTYLFKWNATDNFAQTMMCNFSINGAVNASDIISANGNGAVNASEYSLSGLRTGSYNWSVSCIDDATNIGYSSTYNFTVILPPKVTLVSPANDTGNSLAQTTFTYIPSEGSGIYNSCTLILNGANYATNNTITPEVENSFTANLPDGIYDWNVNCTDSNNLYALAPYNWTYFVDTVAPYLVNAIYPENQSTVTRNNVSFIFNANDTTSPLMSCTIYLDDGTGFFMLASNLNVMSGENYTYSYLLGDGNYSWYVDCTDKGGNFNVSQINNFTIKAPPNVTLIYPTTDSWFNLTSITFRYVPDDDIQITNCSWFINGVYNGSSSTILNKEENAFTLNNLVPNQYNWTVSCRDSDNNWFTPENNTFYVDTKSPTISLYSPLNLATLNSSSVLFNFSATDDQSPQLYCDLTIDGIVNQSNILLNNSVPYNVLVSNFNDGNHLWNLTCRDLAGNTNASETRTFTVAEPPRVSLGNPINNYRTNITTISLFYTPIDNSNNVAQCSLLLNGSVVATNNTITNNAENSFVLENLAGGSYFWDVNCSDAQGNSAINGTVKYFHIDLFAPQITLIKPEINETFNSNNVTFNFTAVDFNSSILLNCSIEISDPLGNRLIENLMGYSSQMFNYTANNLSDGEHFWNVTCSDDFGNTNTSETRTFYINRPDLFVNSSSISFNNSNPNLFETINITLNVSNIGGIVATNANVKFYDGNPALGGVLIGTDSRDVYENTTVLFSTIYVITEGYHEIFAIVDSDNLIAELNETNNNASTNISVLRAVINSPANNSMFNYNNITFNFTLQDYTSGILNYSVFVDGIFSGVSGITNDNESTIINLTLNEGTHTILIQATDYILRKKNSTAITIIIDTSAPVPNILTLNRTWYNYTTPQINITATDNIDSIINYTIYANNSQNYYGSIQNATSNLISLNVLTEGLYELIMEAFDELNNKANSSSKFIYVDLTPPSTTLNSPQGGVNFSNRTVALNYTATDNLADVLNCSIMLDGIIVNSRIVGNGNSAEYIATNLYEGTHTWNVTCYDEAQNINTSETREFNVYIGPTIELISPLNNYWSKYSSNTFYYNVSDETGLASCSILLNGTVMQTKLSGELIVNGTNNFTISGMNGEYLWAIACFDNTTFSAYNISLSRTIFVDIVPPSSLIYTQNNSWFNSTPTIYFNLSDNMDSILNYTLFVNGTVNMTGTSNNGVNSSAVLAGFSDGTYEIIIQAMDEAENYQNSSPIVIGVDTIKPYIELISPANNTNYTQNTLNLSFTPYDNSMQNLVCSLTLDNVQVLTNAQIQSGQNYNYTASNLSGGFHFWNVTCFDLAGNFNTSKTWQFYIYRPDLYINESNIFFSNEMPSENETITITATIENIGTTFSGNFLVEFFENSPALGGISIGNATINLSAGEIQNVSVTYLTKIGTREIYVLLDSENLVAEENESNNNASKTIFVGLWHFAFGNTFDRLVTRDAELGLLYDWEIDNSTSSNIFVADSDSNINWRELQALGRDIANNSHAGDFETLDEKLNSSDYADSINLTYTLGGTPIETTTLEIYGANIVNVPVHNSTNNSNFKTGIIWDFGDGGNSFDGTQDIVFVTQTNNQAQGYNSTLDYEIRIPATLRSYKGPDNSRVDFYMEIK